jgi:hypothetical protein
MARIMDSCIGASVFLLVRFRAVEPARRHRSRPTGSKARASDGPKEAGQERCRPQATGVSRRFANRFPIDRRPGTRLFPLALQSAIPEGRALVHRAAMQLAVPGRATCSPAGPNLPEQDSP